MCEKIDAVRALVSERLTAAAEEIFALVERTIVDYEEELCRSKEENQRKQQLLDSLLDAQLHTTTDVQIQTERNKEQSDVKPKDWNSEFTSLPVKSEESRSSEEVQLVQMEMGQERLDSEPLTMTMEQHYDVQIINSITCVQEAERNVPEEISVQESEANVSQETSVQKPRRNVRQKTSVQESPRNVSKKTSVQDRDKNVPEKSSKRKRKTNPTQETLQQKQTGESRKMPRKSVKSERRGSSGVSRVSPQKIHKKDSSAAAQSKCSKPRRTWSRKSQTFTSLTKKKVKAEFKCSVCEKSYNRFHHLERHITVHTGERSFICAICHKTFRLKQYLISHMATHTDERIFSCSSVMLSLNVKII
ncbi:hypothetical protein WMY93_024743 [Mugilogobius chulae]|uniref:C2H2-type domain-containing protein n=1 Tax=Mugilogobius chulae TaxID=88201 RepID=A0AAW0N3S5_9GOBI